MATTTATLMYSLRGSILWFNGWYMVATECLGYSSRQNLFISYTLFVYVAWQSLC